MKVLQKIQQELKANKGQYNEFGKYAYRSCEDILEAAKPVLAKYDAAITLSDDIVLIGDRYYVKATATLTVEKDKDTALTFTTTAFAREAVARKGMDESQITGSASSYARKYALSGLFALDDTKDADTMDNRAKPAPQETQKATPVADKLVVARAKKCKTQAELNALWHKLQDEMGDNFADVKGVYTVVFAQRKAEIAKAGATNANN